MIEGRRSSSLLLAGIEQVLLYMLTIVMNFLHPPYMVYRLDEEVLHVQGGSRGSLDLSRTAG
jgi:hypothetical protein